MTKMSQSARVVAALSDGLWHSIQDIHLQAGTMRLNSRVAELRSRGYDIACRKTGGRYAYRLLSRPGPAEDGTSSDGVGVQRESAGVGASTDASGALPRRLPATNDRGNGAPDAVAGSGLTDGIGAPAPLPEPLFDMPKKAAWA